MPLYPNYSMTNYMYQNPYQQAWPQAPQMPMQSVGLSGKIVDDFNAITPNDVPMDSFGAIFVKSDGTEVQRKVWDKNGRIITIPFKAVTEGFGNQPYNLSETQTKFDTEAFNVLNSKIDKLSERLEEALKGKVSKSKKEGENE